MISSRRFAQADHQAGLGEAVGIDLLDPLQQAQRREIARAGPDREIEPRHGFEIVVEDVGRRRHHASRRAPSLRRKSGVSTSIVVPGRCARMASIGRGEMRRAAIGEIVAVDRGDHHMGEAQLRHRARDIVRLVRIERARQARSSRCRRRRRACRCRP